MDVEKLIQAAEHCYKEHACMSCGHQMESECMHVLGYSEKETAKAIIFVRDHYEALLKAERSKVVHEVREWAKDAVFTDSWGMPAIYLYQITEKLDSMEPDKEEKQ